MPTLTSDICIGSYLSLPAQTISVTVGATTEDVVLAAGSYYLYDASSSLSLLASFAAALETHSALSGVNAVVLRNRLVDIGADQAFTLTWPTDGVLRDLLGFTGNLSPASDRHTAPDISPLLWSAGRTATYRARYGTDGVLTHDTAVGQSAPGTVRGTRHNTYRTNTIIWRYVTNARVWTTDEEGGEFFAFWDQCLSRLVQFKVYRNTVEDTASDSQMTFGTVLPSTGAYVMAPTDNVGAMPWDREFGFVESLHPITIPVATAAEYS